MTITTSQLISVNIGTSANDGTGDPLRTAFSKINSNFSNIQSIGVSVGNLIVSGGLTLNGITWGGPSLVAANITLSGSISGNTILSAPSVAGTNNALPPLSGNLGYLITPQKIQSTDYTCVSTDTGIEILHPIGAAPATYTIPSNANVAYDIGTSIMFTNLSANICNVAIQSTDTLYLSNSGATGTRTISPFGTATAQKKTSNIWLISGFGIS